MTLLERSEESEATLLTRLGTILLLSLVVILVIYLAVKQFAPPATNVVSVRLRVPYSGQGVEPETPVIMHGVKIGEVSSVSSLAGGGVQFDLKLQANSVRDLTDSLQIDYRPSNYFGVTGINVQPGQGGQRLRNGMQLTIAPQGNYSLQALLYRLGEITHGVLDDRLISVMNRGTQYVDAFRPLIETALIVSTTVTDVQTVSTERLLRNATGISVAFPGTADALIGVGNDFIHNYFGDKSKPENAELLRSKMKFWPAMDEAHRKQYETNQQKWFANMDNDNYNVRVWDVIMDKAKSDLFAKVGALEYSHVNDLFPLIESLRGLTDTAPKIFDPDVFGATITELRTRFERMYASSGDLHALPVRIVLDRVPGVESALGYGVGAP
ncbi:MlaD family protein [Mycobacterium sp. E1747]|uniref:MlaD family protein n=1 Tax=Mycobacterium sp. E1747 TaxID=1834128 RepID=UPI0007FC0976|nr:MlaD family protein [Mycobacterium sp. E1747]OBH05882.1 hypothetical protein A5695_06475 [Mycobacterium sp. E1747]